MNNHQYRASRAAWGLSASIAILTVVTIICLVSLSGCSTTDGALPSASSAGALAGASTAASTVPRVNNSISAASATTAAAATSGLTLVSSAFVDGRTLPTIYTCDGASTSPPLSWSGAPAGTVGYALVMRHTETQGTRWYWVLYDMAASVTQLVAGDAPPATVGTTSVGPEHAYAAPCSKGPGLKKYSFDLYALSAQPTFAAGTEVSRDALLTAISGHILATTTLNVTYARAGMQDPGSGQGSGQGPTGIPSRAP